MRNHVTFVADGFERSHPGPDADDAPPPGEDLARWLIAELGVSGGLDAAPEPMPEDWGWRVFVSVDGLSANLGAGECGALPVTHRKGSSPLAIAHPPAARPGLRRRHRDGAGAAHRLGAARPTRRDVSTAVAERLHRHVPMCGAHR